MYMPNSLIMTVSSLYNVIDIVVDFGLLYQCIGVDPDRQEF
jgi:hypothetical protein